MDKLRKVKNSYFKILKLKNKILFGGPTLVLMYHRISNVHLKPLAHLTVSTSTFDAQLKYLKYNYRIFSVSDSWKLPFYKKGVVLTFDDGYADNFMNALPILEKYNIPATIFVCSGNIGKPDNFWWDELAIVFDVLPNEFLTPNNTEKVSKNKGTYRQLSSFLTDLRNPEKTNWMNRLRKINNIESIEDDSYRSLTKNELIKLGNHPLITIGGHSHNHYPLENESKDVQEKEIKKGNLFLKNILKKDIQYFAFPHGSYNKETKEILKDMDIKASFLANNYYSNEHKKRKGTVSRILITNISGNTLKNYLNKYI
jgi:peptidoglycan/xylan/chitin deacetylase (PgdA/CDA1 family)